MDDAAQVGPSRRSSHRWKAALLVAIVVAAVVVAVTVDIPDPQPLRDRVDSAGAWGLVLFVLVYIAVSLTPFPASALTIASGLLFGLLEGTIVVMVAATIGAWFGFLLARWLGRDGVARLGWERIASIDAILRRRGLIAMVLIRLIPFPFAVVNYAAGLSAIRGRDYLIGTVVGILPSAIGYTAVGAYGTSPLSWPFVGALAAVAVIAIVSGVAARRLRHPDPTPETSAGEPIDDVVGH
ncbi:TVP38/TMEM64 family protein [Williamsia sp. Leaf354]|uniref:TVP38/TMEM64 family protein n=1 Tax=Williamsia sp. Leaf354 TaxID=1736349 RepID=UPI0009E79AF6|nr:TVP38/TMEM64 family protein [Williamsia sp. Leaf354]